MPETKARNEQRRFVHFYAPFVSGDDAEPSAHCAFYIIAMPPLICNVWPVM